MFSSCKICFSFQPSSLFQLLFLNDFLSLKGEEGHPECQGKLQGNTVSCDKTEKQGMMFSLEGATYWSSFGNEGLSHTCIQMAHTCIGRCTHGHTHVPIHHLSSPNQDTSAISPMLSFLLVHLEAFLLPLPGAPRTSPEQNFTLVFNIDQLLTRSVVCQKVMCDNKKIVDIESHWRG